MKILNIISRVIQGPVFYPFLYGDVLNIIGIIGIFSPYVTNKVYGLGVLIIIHSIINAYQLSTLQFASTYELKKASQETLKTVNKIAQEERILRCTVKTITDATAPTLQIIKRFPIYAEVYLSEHFETAEYQNTLIFLVKTEFKKINEGFWVILTWSSMGFGIQLGNLNAAALLLKNQTSYSFWIPFTVIVQITTMFRRWHLTSIAKNSIFRWDAKAAEQMGIENAIQALEHIEEISDNDKETAEFAEWEMAYPKIATRIAKLKGMQKT
jgi:hypothetical protein